MIYNLICEALRLLTFVNYLKEYSYRMCFCLFLRRKYLRMKQNRVSESDSRAGSWIQQTIPYLRLENAVILKSSKTFKLPE